MNREILFRGKRKHNNEWVYGSLVDNSTTTDTVHLILTRGLIVFTIHLETVGQYTGLNYQNEKDGRKMFEGDVFRRYNDLFVIKVGDFHGYRFVVELADGSGGGTDTLTKGDAEYGEYVGNIHDNPELISKKHE